MEVSRSYLTFFQRNHDLKGPFVAQRIVLRYALVIGLQISLFHLEEKYFLTPVNLA